MTKQAAAGWKACLIEQGYGELAERLTLVRALVNEQNRSISVQFEGRGESIPNGDKLVAGAFSATLSQAKVSVDIVWKPMEQRNLEDELAAGGRFILDALLEEMPSFKAWMDGTELSLEGDTLTVKLPQPMLVETLLHKNADHLLQEHIAKHFGRAMAVKFDSDGAADEEAEAEEKEKLLQEKAKLAVVQPPAEAVKPSTSQPEKSSRASRKGSGPKRIKANEDTLMGYGIGNEATTPIEELSLESGRVTVRGEVVSLETRPLKDGLKALVNFALTDYTSSIYVKSFLKLEKLEEIEKDLKPGCWLKVRGEVVLDTFSQEAVIMAKDLEKAQPEVRLDEAEEKRVELHLHTQMSSMDSVLSIKKAIDQATAWGHKALAITDHGVVQAFPEAYDYASRKDFKIIFGVEGYLMEDLQSIVQGGACGDFNRTFVVFDVETTGLYAGKDRLTEIGAVKIEDRKVVGRFSTFVNPEMPIPAKITELTSITDAMVADAPKAGPALQEFYKFAEGSILVAHNASFDVGFLKAEAKRTDGPDFSGFAVMDTLLLARQIFRELKRHRLDTIARHLKISMGRHHRAVDDANTTGEILLQSLKRLEEQDIHTLEVIDRKLNDQNVAGIGRHHIIVLAKNQEGLMNLYKLITISHLEYFNRTPRLPRDVMQKYRKGLLFGSACEQGELFKAILDGRPEAELERIADFYDFLEIQPLGNNEFLIRQGRADRQRLIDINKKIIALGDRLGKPVVATCDVHFLNPRDEVFRRILMKGQGFEDADQQAPLYFRSTTEMLAEFDYLDPETARRVVIEAPNAIADQIEAMRPFPNETFHPKIEGAEDAVREMATKRAHEIYGDPLPDIVEARLDKELKSIIGHGFAVLYWIAHKLVKKSLSDGYLVGSRGSVGSSLVATFLEITEVNALPPHYVCPKCKHSDFNVDVKKYACGVDLPPTDCPHCGTAMLRQGYDIPFEVFLGFEGDKVPDIDLNFSGEYQSVMHKYTEEIFGTGNVFRAGTIGTVKEKTAYGFVLKYFEEKGMLERISKAELDRLSKGCSGVKRTTGQHPGGIVVVPKEIDVHLFTPVQHPADDKTSGIITTHFDFNSLHDRLVKLDILGHDDPTMIRMLQDLTGVDPFSIPLNDERVMSLFSTTETLGVTPEELDCQVGTYFIPEFGTSFVQEMLIETRPKTMAELIRISGLSHGTDVWLNNAQELIRKNIAVLKETICTRDDIMNQLIAEGVPPKMAFTTMESVRKGKGLKPEMEEAMIEHGVPEWFMDSCRKIKYMFPKAHAAAYVMMALRIAYFKVYYPKAFYAACLSIRALADFDALTMTKGLDAVREERKALNEKGKATKLSVKEKDRLTVLELIVEMNLRGIFFEDIDLYKSDAKKFIITDKGLLPPFMAVPGLGEAAARSIVEARKDGPFISIEDFQQRTTVNKTNIEIFKGLGCFKDLPDSNQLSLFAGLSL
jgi:DNA polymerase-3 subunit alpha (Gram-positive type)